MKARPPKNWVALMEVIVQLARQESNEESQAMMANVWQARRQGGMSMPEFRQYEGAIRKQAAEADRLLTGVSSWLAAFE